MKKFFLLFTVPSWYNLSMQVIKGVKTWRETIINKKEDNIYPNDDYPLAGI